ncbi:large ribosomal subunit protein mL66-like [Amphiura filiformis]|uniref:large ribosomal subunit protein mL66-like n=1 Tax=Amphiura filiformis TaxID=82378 RepID=UPI003B2180C6
MATTMLISGVRRVITSKILPISSRSLFHNVISEQTNIIRKLAAVRLMSSESQNKYRKVTEETVGDATTIGADYSDIPEDFHPVDNAHTACPICSRNLKVTYKDVLILSQFINPQGGLLPRRLTGVCKKQQDHLAKCLHQAHITGLIPNHKPPKVYGSFKEQGWKPRRKVKYHRYDGGRKTGQWT